MSLAKRSYSSKEKDGRGGILEWEEEEMSGESDPPPLQEAWAPCIEYLKKS